MTDELTEAQRKRLEQLARLCPLTLSLSQADGDAIHALLAALDQRDAEVERLRLAICGGEDAPGYAMSLPLETILQVQDDNRQTWKRDSELAWDGETANSWKARAQAAEQRLKAVTEALEDATAHLVAATSLARDGGRKAAASNKIFHIMLDDYEKSADRARQALAAAQAPAGENSDEQ